MRKLYARATALLLNEWKIAKAVFKEENDPLMGAWVEFNQRKCAQYLAKRIINGRK